MKTKYIKRKGTADYHIVAGAPVFGGYTTACGLTLPPRDLGRIIEKRPEGFELCADCAAKENG